MLKLFCYSVGIILLTYFITFHEINMDKNKMELTSGVHWIT